MDFNGSDVPINKEFTFCSSKTSAFCGTADCSSQIIRKIGNKTALAVYLILSNEFSD